ncbi:amidohydrolase family protein [Martelella lutilitoris]|uniref:Amidohydrolase family protein n=1 Tax=Martelella lutilitoris TaxID=2583532 RepID=A0A5C4JQ63_9HYPH|nr:amidohydrolase family protein [Martelella lutilitoris]TNB47478.1 amidohydrolase family protein [Martelella lutilitoris]
MADIDFLIRNTRLAGHPTPVDIAFSGDRIASVASGIACDAPSFDAEGRLATSGLTETHIHLDKAGIIGRCALCEGTLAEAVRETAQAKAAFTEADVYARAATVVEQAMSHGTTLMRSFVEIDPRAGFRSFEAIKAIRRDYADAIEIIICAFAQEGLTNDPGTEEMLAEALANGADQVGGCPYTDADPAVHVTKIFDLAERFGVNVDFHVDFDLKPEGSNLGAIIAETKRRGYQGRVSIGHVTKLSVLEPVAFAEALAGLAEAGIALTVLPATDLYLNGREFTHLVPRGMTPGHRLIAAGGIATLSTNNVLNPFTPFGDASLMRMANLYANIAQLGTPDDLATVYDMMTGQADRLLGREPAAIVEGGPATVVLFDAETPAEAVATVAPALCGWRNGKKTFERPPARIFCSPGA